MSNKLVETIRTIVQTEMAKTLKPMLKEVLKPMVKEMIEQQVNAVLAEKFIQNLSVGQSVVKEQTSPRPKEDQAARLANRRQELLQKMGTNQNPMMKLIYEDVNVDDTPVSGDPTGEDEGVDISQFGF